MYKEQLVISKLKRLIDLIVEKTDTADSFIHSDMVKVEEILQIVQKNSTFSSVDATIANDLWRKYTGQKSSMEEETIDFLKQSKKIGAIKKVRLRTGWGLKDSKDYVDGIQDRENIIMDWNK